MFTKYMEERILIESCYYSIMPVATVRSTAETFGVSKSTVHKDLVYRLPKLYGHEELKESVKRRIEENTKERSIRGGEATRKKYLKMKTN